jgi:hypothetical protein
MPIAALARSWMEKHNGYHDSVIPRLQLEQHVGSTRDTATAQLRKHPSYTPMRALPC